MPAIGFSQVYKIEWLSRAPHRAAGVCSAGPLLLSGSRRVHCGNTFLRDDLSCRQPARGTNFDVHEII